MNRACRTFGAVFDDREQSNDTMVPDPDEDCSMVLRYSDRNPGRESA